MKKLFLLFLFLPFGLLAQPVPTDSSSGKYSVSETVAVPGVSQKELHDKTLQFLAKFAKVPAASIQEDKEDKIVFKGYKKLNVKTDDLKTTFPLHYVLTVQFQDGSYKYKATDFSPDGINLYNKESLKHPDQHKFKNKKDKEAYVTVYESYSAGMHSVGKELKAAIKRPAPTVKK
jgi:hypothetical protein